LLPTQDEYPNNQDDYLKIWQSFSLLLACQDKE
jgi:hypothetical protein